MKRLLKAIGYTLAIVVLCAFQTSAVFAGGNDFIVTDLRLDLPELAGSGDYIAYVSATQKPTGTHPGDFTTGWLSVDLDNQPGTYGAKFTQVGLMTEPGDPEGKLYWFVYSEEPITCLQGTPFWWNWDKLRFFGCIGEPDSLASLQEWTRVELVTYGQGSWIARVDDLNGNVADVAQITTTHYTIFRANVNMEQAYLDAADPYLLGRFFFWHPQYMEWGVGFHDWPPSLGANVNNLYATSRPLGINNFCPQHYGATINLFGDPRYWYAGTGGQICSADMFSYHQFIPIAMNN